MPKQAMFTLKLETDLHADFMAEADASKRPASQLVREFMRDFVTSQREARAHDAWFRSEVEKGLRDADDPSVARVDNRDATASWQEQRRRLVSQAAPRAE